MDNKDNTPTVDAKTKSMIDVYKELETKAAARMSNRSTRGYSQNDIRTHVTGLFKALDKPELLLSAVVGMVKMDTKFKDITYTEVRTAVLYKKQFNLVKRDEKVWITLGDDNKTKTSAISVPPILSEVPQVPQAPPSEPNKEPEKLPSKEPEKLPEKKKLIKGAKTIIHKDNPIL